MNSSCNQPVALPSNRRGASPFSIMATLLVLGGIGAASYYVWAARSNDEGKTNAILHEVQRDDFTLSVTERGEIESAGVVEVKSEVKTNNTPGLAILRIVPEGTHVEEGDFLIELDSSALEEERTTRQITANTNLAVVVEAKNLYETAVIAKREYIEGTFVQEKQTIESEMFVAEENLNRAKEYFEYSKKLAAKGYVNDLQLEADKFAVEKSQKELEAANTKLRVLENFTKEKMVKQLESDIIIAKTKWESDQKSHELERGKLEDVEDQIRKCTILAPHQGVVTYAHSRDHRGNNEFVVEEGAVIRERQTIIKLPDASSMRVELTINESLIQYVKPGMPAKIFPVGLGDQVFKGQVEKVNRYAEPSGWRKANVKEYKAYVTIEEPDAKLRSGMTTSVTINCLEEPDAIQAPVQSVYAHGEDFFCFVREAGRWNAKKVEVGPTNDKFFVIRGGLNENDAVAMNPKRMVSEVNLPPLPQQKAADGQQPIAEGLQLPEKVAEHSEATQSSAGG
ncbi:efflux RND transporter periplasmic adaptor subunit [Adhaeretor mobilis]|uniref:Putative efflux pump membrane fusion protein n=1 Tax=Adhaeretor mobilis TaxID=1930276 RepID=A0A517MZP0_9BACT|nr:HlyD family efflux transporter periplasmic adaptor subunit [Adhaeretor mobilis]QDT00349.1 putative efflux pump membrane fusion protein [Adhaeretor mobilis]